MNWLGKIESFLITARTEAVAYWEVAALLSVSCAIVAAIIAAKDNEKREAMRSKMRIFLYCKNCQYADLNTETCAIGAAKNEKCAVIDRTAGQSFTATKD